MSNIIYYTVYIHTCQVTNKSYIGFTSTSTEKRWKSHLRSAKNKLKTNYHHFQKAINKYGPDKWIHNDLFIAFDKKEALRAEQELINSYNTFNNGYNSSIGGEQSKCMKGSNNPMFGKSRNGKFKGSNNPNSKVWRITHPDNTVTITDDRKSFCEEHSLNYNSVKHRCSMNKPHKGYFFKPNDPLYEQHQ